MKWPYNKCLEAAHAWGVVAVGTAGLVGMPTVLATLHATDRHFRWWWPTNWMLVPAIALVLGLVLIVLPVRREGDDMKESTSQSGEHVADVTGEVGARYVAGDVAGVRGKIVKSGKINGKVKVEYLKKGARASGVDIDRIG
jgi:hypothetical protein